MSGRHGDLIFLVVSNIYGVSVLILLHVTGLAPGILSLLMYFLDNLCAQV
jgi:hypothetical protein